MEIVVQMKFCPSALDSVEGQQVNAREKYCSVVEDITLDDDTLLEVVDKIEHE